jgi:tetratricopeptide (TPR) repeat protein
VNRLLLLIAALSFAVTGCRQDFKPFLDKAEKAFAERNYINTIDELNLGMPHWREADGDEAKARAYELLGRSYQGLRNTDKAIDAYQQAVKLSPEAFDAAYNLGNLYLLKNQPRLAMGAFQQALRSRPKDALSLLGLANSLYALERYNEAAQAFQRVIDVSPGVTEALDSLQAIRNRRRR